MSQKNDFRFWQLLVIDGISTQISWETGIRTPIPWSRATCPAVGRSPSIKTVGTYLSVSAKVPDNFHQIYMGKMFCQVNADPFHPLFQFKITIYRHQGKNNSGRACPKRVFPSFKLFPGIRQGQNRYLNLKMTDCHFEMTATMALPVILILQRLLLN